MVDKIDDCRRHRAAPVNIKENICAMRLKPKESVNRADKGLGEDCYVQNRDRVRILSCYSLGRRECENAERMRAQEELVQKDQAFCLYARCSRKNLLGPWSMKSLWMDAILLNWGVIALRVSVP